MKKTAQFQQPQDLARITDPAHLGREFDFYLLFEAADREILDEYRELLVRQSLRFADVCYEYLFTYPSMSDVMHRFERNGGDLGGLVREHQRHLLWILTISDDDTRNAKTLAIGQSHFSKNIDPMWIVGSYRLFLSHLSNLVGSSPDIDPPHRSPLQNAITKFLFRDMGLMLEGYWSASTGLIDQEKARLDQHQSRTNSLLENIPVVLWSIDVVSGETLFLSSGNHLNGFKLAMPIPCLEWSSVESRKKLKSAWKKACKGQQVEMEAATVSPDGEDRWFRWGFYPYVDEMGRVLRVDGNMEDVTSTVLAQERLEHLATTDVLTGMANRALWYDRLGQSISAARRSGRQLVVMLMDLNQFKMINDTIGHPAGDKVLQETAARIAPVLRGMDTLARFGGDEFAVLLPDLENADKAADKVARKILQCFEDPMEFNGEQLYLSASLGIAVYPEHGEDIDSLVSRADIAMYAAKRDGSGFGFYGHGADSAPAEHLQISGWVRRAMENDGFELFYQPKVDIQNRRVSGVEALLRLRHPDHGIVGPDRFIPIAEKMGVMTPITDWVLATALKQTKVWNSNGINMPVSINVSARSFQTPGLIAKIQRALDIAEVDGDSLEIEITERALMTDLDNGSSIIGSLSDLGIAVAIDDFGTGYSSLSYLKRLPIHSLKIDRSFFTDITADENDAVLVRSIIDLGHNLGYKVVAEGVENRDSWDLLEILGCDAAQGFHVAKPLACKQFESWLSNEHQSPVLN